MAVPARPEVPFRGPGRKADVCPQVTLEALRAFSYLPPDDRPAEIVERGASSLRVWRERGTSKPYMFGHGRQFKRGKWPATWYSALEARRHPRALPGAVGRSARRSRRPPRAGRGRGLRRRLQLRRRGTRGTPLVLQGLRAALVRPEEGAVAVRDRKYVRSDQAGECARPGDQRGGCACARKFEGWERSRLAAVATAHPAHLGRNASGINASSRRRLS